MLEYYRLYLPKSKREIKMEVSTPRQKNNIVFDTVYFLDGQNAFKDSHASFGRSIRAAKTLGITAKEMGKRVLGVAIYNSESDLGRVNEYSPFKIINAASKEWLKQDIDVCKIATDETLTESKNISPVNNVEENQQNDSQSSMSNKHNEMTIFDYYEFLSFLLDKLKNQDSALLYSLLP